MINGKETFIRFLKSIKIENFEDFDMEFLNIGRSKTEDNTYFYSIQKDSPWTFKLTQQFIQALSNIVSYRYEIIFSYSFAYPSEDIVQLVREWYFNATFENPDFDITVVNETINITFTEEAKYNDFCKKELDLEGLLKFLCLNYKINVSIYKLKENITSMTKKDQIDDEEEVDAEKEFQDIKEKAENDLVISLQENYNRMQEERRHNDIFKKGNYAYFQIGGINENSGAVDFNGMVFEIADPRESKSGKLIYRIGVGDETGAIYVTIISNNTSLSPDTLAKIKLGCNIRIKGRVDIEKYRKELYVMCHYFDLLPDKELRDDNFAGEKRVELHLHTKMSEMDGVTEIADYCKLAKHMGHKAIAVTDHGVVQAFPEAQAAAKKYGIKILYGCELYLIEDFLHVSKNPTNQRLDDCDFVCFDLETTGLSIKYDRITEFGAVKIKNGFVVDRLDILINPGKQIPKKIEEKTNITNEMVSSCPKIGDVLDQILSFIGNCVLVSHNIEFDYGMLNEALEREKGFSLSIPAIDTLALSRFYFPDRNRHSLGELCKRFEVNYDEESAHRADYDAEVLSECFLALRTYINKDFKNATLKQLENLEMPNELLQRRTFRPYHCTVYCKNRLGLKDLYKIVSESHIDHMGYAPFTPKSVLEKYRKNLIVGSACFNGEVFQKSMLSSEKTLQKAINFYDFIEIQPIDNYSFLINTNEIDSYEDLNKYIRDIVRVAEKENKLICATGDVHFANPEDKIYRDIFIGNKTVGRGNHPLNPFYRKDLPPFENPDQYFRTTEEMLDCFSYFGDEKAYEYVVTNTNKIADMCEEIIPIPDQLFTPEIDNCENMLKEICYKNLKKNYGENPPELIKKRLDEELHGIISNGYSVTYYIAHKLIEKANEDGYIVGSRGSVGSSFAATMAGITEVNPLPPHYRCPKCKHTEFYEGNDITSGYDLPEKVCPHCGEKMIGDGQNIPFQTFLGFNAEKVPDIDLNFPTDYQATAHNYTKVLLGVDNVFRAGTISKVQFKTAFGFVKNYYEDFLRVPRTSVSSAYIAYLAYGCTNVKRTTGQHPGGIVVVPRKYDVYDFTPVQYPAGNVEADWKTTHFDFHSIHDTILKLDMLGHQDPQALKMMEDLTGFDCHKIPFNDSKVYSLFTTDDALNLQHKYLPKDNGASGLPEFGTNFVRQMLRETNPHTFRDLLIISGLSHGTDVWNNNAQELINNHIVDLRGVIGCRDDIMTFLISKGMDSSESFKIMEAVRKGKKLTPANEESMKAHNVPQYYIDSCNKIKYLFPKGHACAYVMMALRVGYYKIYYPLEYYATFFTLRCKQYDIAVMIKGIDAIYEKLVEFKTRRSSNNPELALSEKEEEIEKTLNVALEMEERGFTFQNISLKRSDSVNFIVDKETKSLIPPFKVLDGLGEVASKTIVEARKEQSFISKNDLMKRGKLSKTNMELLDKLGVLKGLTDTNQMSLFDDFF